MGKLSVTVRVASWSAHHPWRAITGWFLFVALCLAVGTMVGTNSATTEDYRVGEAGRAEAIAADSGLARQPTEYVLIDSPSGPLDQAAADSAARDIVSRMRALPEVRGVAEPVRSADGRTVLVAVTMNGEELAAQKRIEPLLAQTSAVQAAYPGLRVVETGRPSMSRGLNDQRADDLLLSEVITLPATLIVLLVAFGSVLAAGVPVLLALSSVAAAMGLSALASHLLPDAGVGNSVILLIGMAVGVDYSLFYLKREREERARAGGRISPTAAVELAATTAGRAIVVSGLAVVLSTACLYLATDVIFSSLATGTIIVVLVAVASSLTVLPALLVTLGRRSERRSDRLARKTARETAGKTDRLARKTEIGHIWTALLRPAGRHPLATLLLATAALLGLALPALDLNLGVPGPATHSRDIPAVKVYDRFTEAFPNARTTHVVVVRANTARVREALAELARRTAEDPLFGTDTAPKVRTSADGRVSTLELSVPFDSGTPRAQQTLHNLRVDHVPATIGRVAGAEVAVTGDVARDADYLTHQNQKLPWVVGFLLLLTFVMTVAAFRSVVIGIVGVLLNLLSAASAFGLLVLVFQHSWAEGLLGFTSTGFIGSRVPLFLFVILFGLSMDYQVFVVSRIRESVLLGMPTRRAVFDGIGGSAAVVTSAAVVMTTVFASFVFLTLIEMKQIGFVLATAVLLDAFVIRILILPSVLTLLGRASWWPSRTMRRAESGVGPVSAQPAASWDQPTVTFQPPTHAG